MSETADRCQAPLLGVVATGVGGPNTLTRMRLSMTGTWAVTAYRSDEGMVEPSTEGKAAVLVVDAATVAGTMGVNRFTGQLVDGLLGPALAMTRMAGPPQLMSQEDLLMSHLHEADTVAVTDEGMTLSRDGLALVELRRSGTNGPESSS
jgi:heat shock protein HslJ